MSSRAVVQRHPLCAGPGCSVCARIDADARRIRDELRDRRARLADDDLERAFAWLSEADPDLVNEALHETGAPK